jgi:CDP-diacylglycerol--serine O-phosphatidyltransferase
VTAASAGDSATPSSSAAPASSAEPSPPTQPRRHRGWALRDEQTGRPRIRVERFRRGIYILPTLITLGNFGCGFVSILYSLESQFTAASWMIIFAMVADALDGAMARITRTESKFGAQIDSLADVVSFGCAPAILIFERFGLSAHPFWIFPLFYAMAGALRLARYNVIDSTSESHDFRGTPIPAPAGIVAGLVLALERHDLYLDKRVVIALVFVLSYLMVSNIRYPSFRMLLKPEKPHPFRTLVILLLVGVLFLTHFVGAWLCFGAIYYLSGPFVGLKNRSWRFAVQEDPSEEEEITDREGGSELDTEERDAGSVPDSIPDKADPRAR